MINFFRKIRQQSFSENKFSKYILYAIGEIVLVVIGILIALSVNNWNTYRKDRIKEKELLNGIVVNLELNKKLIIERIGFMDDLNEQANLILKLLDKHIMYTDSLDAPLHHATVLPYIFNLPNQGFENLKNEGIDIILNEDLRNEIIKIFNVTYDGTNNRFREAKIRHSHQYQYIDENFETGMNEVSLGGFLHPYNVDKTFNDNYFFSIISSFIYTRAHLKYYLKMNLDETEKLLIQLKKSNF